MGAKEILQGVQFLISKWEAGAISDDFALALIEVHLEREGTLTPGPHVIAPIEQTITGSFTLPLPPEEFHTITQG